MTLIRFWIEQLLLCVINTYILQLDMRILCECIFQRIYPTYTNVCCLINPVAGWERMVHDFITRNLLCQMSASYKHLNVVSCYNNKWKYATWNKSNIHARVQPMWIYLSVYNSLMSHMYIIHGWQTVKQRYVWSTTYITETNLVLRVNSSKPNDA